MTTPVVVLCPIFNGIQQFDNNGQMLSGGKLFAYQSGTGHSVLQDTYTDSSGTTANANPIRYGSTGRFTPAGIKMWLDVTKTYDLVLTLSDGVTIVDFVDNVIGTYNFTNITTLAVPYADATGLADAITATYTVASATLIDGYTLTVGIGNPNITTTPTFQPTLNGVLQAARVIKKFINNVEVALSPGDIQGVAEFKYDLPNTCWVLQNPSPYVTFAPIASPTLTGIPKAPTAAEFDNSTELATTEYVDRTTLPVGSIIFFAGLTPPTNYLACPKVLTLVNIADYPELNTAIGTTWGSAVGQFGLPFFAAGYSLLQLTTAVGVVTHGTVLAHTHTYVTKGGTAPQTGSSTPCWFNTSTLETSAQTPAGGTDNLAAGVGMLICVKYQ